MADLEKFLNDDTQPVPYLLKIGIAHYQFETIHPFLDGNGRVGRLLITLLLCAEGVLREPLLYLSLYLKAHRTAYYDLLDCVRTEGDWEAWLAFFAMGVHETANAAVATAYALRELAQADRERLKHGGRSVNSALRVHEALLTRPINTIARLAGETGLSVPTVTSALSAMIELGLVREVTGRRRGRVFSYGPYLAAMGE